MPIEVITGLPGHGKTLLLVKKLLDAARKAERPLVVCGVDGLRPGLAMTLEDPTRWNAVRPGETCICGKGDGTVCEAHVIPNGALVFVDEAWKWYGHLHNARSQPNPPHVLEFAEHRHRGLDFVMTTQGPGQLYPFLRTLIEGHTHVVRMMGTQSAKLYTWPELNEDVKSRAMRDIAVSKVWPYPKAVFEAYTSATQHTIKRKIPLRVLALPLLLVAFVGLAYVAVRTASPAAIAANVAGGRASDLSDAGPVVSAEGGERPAQFADAQAWAERFMPRIPEYPASAPAWDGREVVSKPQLYCIAVGMDGRDGCSCYTEQATRYEIDQFRCLALVRAGGVYDPFKEPAQPAQAAPVDPSVTEEHPLEIEAVRSASGARSQEQVARYGGFRQ